MACSSISSRWPLGIRAGSPRSIWSIGAPQEGHIRVLNPELAGHPWPCPRGRAGPRFRRSPAARRRPSSYRPDRLGAGVDLRAQRLAGAHLRRPCVRSRRSGPFGRQSGGRHRRMPGCANRHRGSNSTTRAFTQRVTSLSAIWGTTSLRRRGSGSPANCCPPPSPSRSVRESGRRVYPSSWTKAAVANPWPRPTTGTWRSSIRLASSGSCSWRLRWPGASSLQ